MSAEITSVPYLDLSQDFEHLQQEWFGLIRDTGARGSFILGPNVTAFEQEAAQYVGTKYALGVANGTDALMLSLRGLGIGEGDEVITSPYTFFATAEAISMVGATPVFADILPDSFVLDPESVNKRITNRTRAILPVHLFGYPADMTALHALANDSDLYLVEDCAQAFAARHQNHVVGSQGHAGCFSFYPTKVLGCYGDGGLITTNDGDLVERIKKTRNHGAVRPFIHDEVGTNSRLDEIQAALLRIKLRGIDHAVAERNRVASMYAERLTGKVMALPDVPENGLHAYNLYTIRLKQRDRVRQILTDNKVGTSLCYPEPLHLQAVYRHLGYKPGDLPVAEQACHEALSLPIYPGMPEAHVQRVCDLIIGD